MDASQQSLATEFGRRDKSAVSVGLHTLKHIAFLAIAAICLAAYEHFIAQGESSAALVSLIAAAGFGFAPIRALIGVFFKVEGKALHIVHAVGGLALISLPVTGAISGGPMLTRAAQAPFAIMGAAQALMHSNHPRNARQAAALQSFVTSLPEVARVASGQSLSSPASAARAITALSGVIAKAQTLGQTELDADPGFQSAMSQVSTRLGANLGLDAVNLTLSKLSANPATAAAVPALRKQLAAARSSIAGGGRR